MSLTQDKMPDPALASEPAAAKEAGLSLFAGPFLSLWSLPDSWQFVQMLIEAWQGCLIYKSRLGVIDVASLRQVSKGVTSCELCEFQTFYSDPQASPQASISSLVGAVRNSHRPTCSTCLALC